MSFQALFIHWLHFKLNDTFCYPQFFTVLPFQLNPSFIHMILCPERINLQDPYIQFISCYLWAFLFFFKRCQVLLLWCWRLYERVSLIETYIIIVTKNLWSLWEKKPHLQMKKEPGQPWKMANSVSQVKNCYFLSYNEQFTHDSDALRKNTDTFNSHFARHLSS